MRNRFYIDNLNPMRLNSPDAKSITRNIWVLLLFLGTLLMSQMAVAQCQLNCIQFVQVSLDQNCTALITPAIILKNPSDCPGPKLIEVLDKNGNVIPTNPTVTGDYIGQTLKVRVIDPPSGNICWGNILIEDKLAPSFSNCIDYSLPCAMPIDLILQQTAPTVADNCGGPVTVTRSYTKVDLGCGSLPNVAIVTITTTAKDVYGNTSTCVQFVTLYRSPITSVLFPLDLDDVSLPALLCNNANTDPSKTGYPKLDGFNLFAPDCGYLVSYVDQIQINCPGEYKVVRTWTVMDWCGGNPVMRTAIQIIKVIDKEAPTLDCNYDPHNIKVLNTQTGPGYTGCYATVSFPAIQVSDNCSNYNDLVFLTYTYDKNGILYAVPTNGGILNLPLGVYYIHYNVTDGCGNVNFCIVQYEVKDLVPPVVACESLFNVSLTDSVTLVNASTFDDGSYDGCSAVTFLARRMENSKCGFKNETQFSTTVPFYCCDVNNGPVIVALRVLDAAGNYNDCMVQVTVFDNTVQCGSPFDPTNAQTFTKTVTPNTTISSVIAKSYDVPVEVTGIPADAEVVDLNVALDISHEYIDQLTIKLTSPKGTTVTLFQGGNCGVLQSDINATFDDEALPLTCTSGNPAIQGSVKPLTGALLNFDGQGLNSIDLGLTKKNWVLTVFDNAPLGGGKINKVSLIFTYATPLALKPVVSDNTEKCGLTVNWADLDQPNQCQSDFIRRQWTATDAFGNTSACTQRIYFIDQTPLDVIFPKDVTIEDCISINDLLNTGAPIHNGDCELVAIGKEDQVFNIVPDACYKIVRCWTVINWCKYDKNAVHTDLGIQLPGSDLKYRDDGDGYFHYCQTIKVIDKVKPVLTCPGDIVFGSYEPDCGPAFVPIDTLKWADCTPNPIITYSVDYYNDGSVNFVGNGPDASGKYPMGTHKVTFKVSDKCGNFSTCSFNVTVKDAKKPTPVCFPISIPVMPSSGSITLTPNLVNKGSYDNCTTQANLKYTLTPNTFTCADLGDNIVTLTVTDEAGNADFCTTIVNIQDGAGNCTGTIMAKVAGNIKDMNGYGVGQTSIMPGQGLASKATTDNNGDFNFDIASGVSYTFTPSKKINPLNGVSTQDLVIMTNHILGKKQLDNPYKWIAADVNKDGKVSTVDMVIIRKLILHIIDQFPESESWRFVDKDFVFTPGANPLKVNFPEVYPMNSLPKTGATANFVGVKVGDVQGNAASTNVSGNNEVRSSETLYLRAEESLLKAGEEKVIDIKAKDFKEIDGYQFTLQLDNQKLEYVNVIPGKLKNLTEDNFGMTFAHEGKLTTSWNAENVTLADDDVLFSIVVKAKEAVTLSQGITITSTLTNAEAYNTKEDVLNVALQFTQNGKVVATGGFELFQNKPNPFSESSTVGFNLPEVSTASLTIFDMSGRTVKVYDGSFGKGYNEFEIRTAELGSTGVFYYRLDTPTHSGTKKMVILKSY